MAGVEVRSVTRDFGAGRPAVKQVSVSVADGTVLSLLGPSGCGKTTTLRMIAGLERPDAGEIQIGNRLVSAASPEVHVEPEKRDVGMVFQSYAIWPHLSVFDNVAYPLRMRRVPRAEIETRVTGVLEQVGMHHYAAESPSRLSGGMQQRVALARSLVFEPAVLLMDEPFSGLDAPLRERMGAEVRALHDRLGVTSVYVTHDQVEAMVLSDRIAVMHEGEIIQDGTPEEVYLRPSSRAVADFLGFSTDIAASVETVHPPVADRSLVRLVGAGFRGFCYAARGTSVGDRVVVVVRPDAFEVRRDPAPETPGLELAGTVLGSLFLGSRRRVSVAIAGIALRVEMRAEAEAVAPGDNVRLWAPADRLWAIAATPLAPAGPA